MDKDFFWLFVFKNYILDFGVLVFKINVVYFSKEFGIGFDISSGFVDVEFLEEVINGCRKIWVSFCFLN